MASEDTGSLTTEELLKLGFSRVGKNVNVSRGARLFAIKGELGDNVRIDTFAVLTGNIYLGDRVHISPFCFLGGTGGTIRMGNDSGVSTHCSIFTKSDDYTKNVKEHGSRRKVDGDVTIGANSILGSGSIIVPGVTIGDNVIIGCHAVVSQNIASGLILASRALGLIPLGER